MDWQQTAALGLVGLVVGIWAWTRLRKNRAGRACGGGCCGGEAAKRRFAAEPRGDGG